MRKQNYETNDCWFGTERERENGFTHSNDRKSLRFEFNIAAAGGGFTSITLLIGLNDLPDILNRIATEFPEDSIAALSNAAALANEGSLGKIAAQISHLETAIKFVNQKYEEDNQRGNTAYDPNSHIFDMAINKLKNTISSLRQTK